MDVMKRLGILVGGAVVMGPAIPAPNAYLSRVGPKPLHFSPPLPSREEVLRLLPPLDTGLPPKDVPRAVVDSNLPYDASMLFPVPVESLLAPWVDPTFGLPENWVESLLGPPRDASGGIPGGAGDPSGNWGDSRDPSSVRSRSFLTPEDLVPFFVAPETEGNTRFVIPVPFVPVVPSTPPNPSASSRATFRQE